MTPEQRLLHALRKCAGMVGRGIVTGPEFVNKALDEFAYADRVYPEISRSDSGKAGP